MNINEELRYATKIISDLNTCNKTLRANQLKQEQGFNRERKGWDRNLKQLKVDNTNLISQLTQSQISHAKYKAELATKSKKIRSLESMIKILEDKLASAQKDVLSIQNDSSKKEVHSALLRKSEILSLKSKIVELENIKSELESKVNQFECLKSEAISKPIVGGNDEKNITKSDDISTVIESSHIVTAPSNNNISKYFIRRKSMDQAEKIDTCLDTSSITEPAKVDTETTPKISKIDINKTNNNILQEIPNMTSNLAQPENYMPSLIESHSQMRPSLEALPLPIGGIGTIPIMASTLMSPLSAYIFLTLLIIAVIWFVILRRDLSIGKKSDQLRDMWAR